MYLKSMACSAAVVLNIVYMSVRSIFSIVLFKSSVSLLIFLSGYSIYY